MFKQPERISRTEANFRLPMVDEAVNSLALYISTFEPDQPVVEQQLPVEQANAANFSVEQPNTYYAPASDPSYQQRLALAMVEKAFEEKISNEIQ